MLGWTNLRARFNHSLARLDAREALPHVAPIKRRIAPAMAVALGGSLLWNNYQRATTQQGKRKSLIRDALVITGTVAGLIAGFKFTGTKLAKRMADGLARLIGQQPHVHEHIGEAAGHAHHHAVALVTRSGLKERLSNLFKPQLCDHGAEGFINLTSIAFGAIAAGGASGLIADALNGENWRETGAMKLKEGIFQFVGNITFCTAAILAASTGGKMLGRMMAKTPLFKAGARQAVEKTLKKLAEKPVGHLDLMPTSVTTAVETILRQKAAPHDIVHQLDDLLTHEVPHMSRKARQALVESLEAPVQQGKFADVHARIREFVTTGIKQDAQQLLRQHADSRGLLPDADDIAELAQLKAETRGQLFGVLVGLVAGVLGGAWTSNQVNQYLSNQMGLPQGHKKVNLFSAPSPGFGAGKLGDRGIHWWDAILHIDDWPSALYLAGVKSLESVIGILYGISGYLTGTAGTDYSTPERFPVRHPELYTQHQPLRRSYGPPGGQPGSLSV